MKPQTIALYLIGNRKAIEEVAKDRSSLFIGLFFVLICGVAREYDQESFRHAPLFFLLPLLLSAPLAFFHYLAVRGGFLEKNKSNLASYYSLFWMTAPLAFIYAIPVEEFASGIVAIKFNMGLLAIVALWRILLFSRVLSVLLDQSMFKFLLFMIWGGAVIGRIASFFFDMSIVNIMGGTVHSQELAFKASAASVVSAVLTGICILLLFPAIAYHRRKDERRSFPPREFKSSMPWKTMLITVVTAAALMAWKQPVMHRSGQAHMLLTYSTQRGLDYLSQYEPEDFPKTWPPLIPRGNRPMSLWTITKVFEELKPTHAPWIRQRCLDYLKAYLEARDPEAYGFRGGQDLIPTLNALDDSPETISWIRENKNLLLLQQGPLSVNNDRFWELAEKAGIQNDLKERIDQLEEEYN